MKVRISEPLFLKGDYPIDFDFTHGEAHLIKKVSGLRGLEIDDGITSGDTDLYLALAVISLQRAGGVKGADESDLIEELMKQKIGALRLIDDEEDEEVEDDPKASISTGSDESERSSGGSTSPLSDSQDENPDGTGDPT